MGEAPPLIVRYTRTGGFVPEARSCVLDTALLPPGAGDRLAELVRRSGILDGQLPGSFPSHDAPIVTLEVSTGDHAVTVRCPLPLLPPPLAELAQFVDTFCDGGGAASAR